MNIAFHGKTGSGKSLAANNLVLHRDYVKESFALPIKKMCAGIYKHYHGMTMENAQLYIEKEKEKPAAAFMADEKSLYRAIDACLNDEFPEFVKQVDSLHSILFADDVKSPRTMQRLIGTEWGRNKIGVDVWVNQLKKRIGKKKTAFVIDDLRFPNELNFLRKKNFYIVQIVTSRPAVADEDHESESFIDELDFDEQIENEYDEYFLGSVLNLGSKTEEDE